MPSYPDDSAAHLSTTLGAMPTGSVVSEVAKRLLDFFTSGQIEPGTRLPPERSLATSLGVGRSAVREALAALEILGIVIVRPGSGTYLRGSVSELLPRTLSWGLMLGEPRTRELIEVRHGLEVYCARLAAERIDDAGVGRLRGRLTVMRDNQDDDGDLKAFVEADMLFHLEIAEAAGNLVLQELLQSTRSLLRVWVERALRDGRHARLAVAEHERVFAAMAARDPDGAAAAMGEHMRTAGRRVANAITPAGTAPGVGAGGAAATGDQPG
ncbi:MULTISPECIES: FadR/GntR family transcriptional regulator [Actinoalloteichus]|uniref:FadR/GntR family transcriptional regulator n=1 Tax=Actinoalloteichus TaxID=65496 RepID=UPI000950E560|nr:MULTISPECIES: FadR/GntR family transcriptional regulator [Actinoalloteichus]